MPCSQQLQGCAICTSKDDCTECEDPTQSPLKIVDAYGNSSLQCAAGIKVFDTCDFDLKVLEVCAKCTNKTSKECVDCITENLTTYYSATYTDCKECDVSKYF